MKKIYIGTSGFSYKEWKDNFYPENLNAKKWLNFYSQTFPTVELNTTFYHLPLNSTVKNWHSQVTDKFLFSVKVSRYITHQKRLYDCKESVDLFYERMQEFQSKSGPLLFQLPLSFKVNKDLLSEFIKNLSPSYLHVFEFRHESWYIEEIYELLKKNNIALCITDLNGKLSPEIITAKFTYLRLHGPKKAYEGSYRAALKTWKNKIEYWAEQVAVYCYFDNTMKGYAIEDAKKLQEML